MCRQLQVGVPAAPAALGWAWAAGVAAGPSARPARRGHQPFTTLPVMTVVVVVVVVVVAVATYLTWLARRLDRLAVRVEAARAGLVTQLAERAQAAAELGAACDLPELRAAAERAAAGHAATRGGAAPLDTTFEEAENLLSRALRAPAVAAAGQSAPAQLHAVDAAAARVALARQLHNDAVRDLRALRGRRLVRLLHLSGRRPLPGYFEIDDALPVRDEPRPAPGAPPAATPTVAPAAEPPVAAQPAAAPPAATVYPETRPPDARPAPPEAAPPVAAAATCAKEQPAGPGTADAAAADEVTEPTA